LESSKGKKRGEISTQKMKTQPLTTLACLLICLFHVSQTRASQIFDMENVDLQRFEDFLSKSFVFFQQKMDTNTFTNKDMKLLAELVEFVFRMKEGVDKRRMKEGPVYWYSRMG